MLLGPTDLVPCQSCSSTPLEASWCALPQQKVSSATSEDGGYSVELVAQWYATVVHSSAFLCLHGCSLFVYHCLRCVGMWAGERASDRF